MNRQFSEPDEERQFNEACDAQDEHCCPECGDLWEHCECEHEMSEHERDERAFDAWVERHA